MIFLGVDGGSTKTEFVLADGEGRLLAHRVYSGCNYIQLGREGFEQFFRQCINEVAAAGGTKAGEITAAMVGLPAYQEAEETEEVIPALFDDIFGPGRCRVANDTVPGWSGSLGAQPGIHIVAGTGSIAFGMDEKGNSCRVGGWSLLFGDDGSGSWLGVRVLNTFFKQADGRLPRTALYDIVREHFGLKQDLYIIGEVNANLDRKQSRFAKYQLLAEKALLAGDDSMAALYEEAARELAAHARAVRGNLEFDPGRPVRVSYYGGVFKAGQVLLGPFRREIEALGMQLVEPRYPPGVGAVALAARSHLAPEQLEAMQQRLHAALAGAK